MQQQSVLARLMGLGTANCQLLSFQLPAVEFPTASCCLPTCFHPSFTDRLRAELQFAGQGKSGAEAELARLRADGAQHVKLKEDEIAAVRGAAGLRVLCRMYAGVWVLGQRALMAQ